MDESFAKIHIDEQPSTDTDYAQNASKASAPSAWHNIGRWFGWNRSANDEALNQELSPTTDTGYRMLPMPELLEKLGIKNDSDGYLDDHLAIQLRHRLRQLGLKLACEIARPLRLRTTDHIALMQIDAPEVSTRTVMSLCLYIIAWFLQSESVTAKDLSIVDKWIDDNLEENKTAPYAKGVLRWLLSRKLVFTRKRKQRCQRIARSANWRNQLLKLLLALASDTENVSQKRMLRLKDIYTSIGLNPADIHSDMHRLATTSMPLTPTVRQTTIDKSKLKAMAESTQKAQQILSSVFQEQEYAAPTQEDQPETIIDSKPGPLMQAIKALSAKAEWNSAEIQELAKSANLPVGAFLENINDYSYDQLDEPLIDDDGDILTVDLDIANQLLNT